MNRIKVILTLVFGLLLTLPAKAASADKSIFDIENGTDLALMILICVLVFTTIILVIITIGIGITQHDMMVKKGVEPPQLFKLFGIFSGNKQGWVGKNEDVLLDGHDYDGIKEFDNDLPPWWKYMFYITIVFAVVYMAYYHVLPINNSQLDEYNEAKIAHAKMYPELDPVYEGPETDASQLEVAAEVFKANCAVCHGTKAEGMAGPNLTDEYWLYKGSINDIFQSIKHGRSRGMKAWKAEFGNKDIYAIASYIMSLQGSKPEGAKAPEGDKYDPAKEENKEAKKETEESSK